MVSKVVFVALIAVFAQALAIPELCPDPSVAKVKMYEEEIREEAPSFGRVSKKVTFSADGKIPTCFLMTSLTSTESCGSVSLSSIGVTKEGDVIVNIVSSIQTGINVLLEVYSE